MRAHLASLLRSRRWEYFIITVIVINAITLGLETDPWMMATFGSLLVALDQTIVVVFVIEICLRIYAFGWRFFRDPWSLFDFAIVAIALMPATGPLTVLRALRILRVMRLISVVPSLRRVIGGLIAALPGMGSIVVLLLLVFYVFSVMATKLYGATFPEWFGSIGASIYTLFQVMTLESWSMGIVRPVMEAHPHAWLFFVPFILSTTYAVLNLFIGVIVSAMQEEHQAVVEAEQEQVHDENMQVLAELRALRSELAEIKTRLA
ncbi:voltage-gated sodium channel [Aurantimonas manganoxydans SI85-9A1]|jgi:voltage-gated sodium channel|uniref:Voltage-gated sodium channel n=1 Tax=Aurantimonas manganoxydans (strain ATCC BAA-1229 / DSM 21871 / SI85-9A1) TaxID=287752 RepID=Q1YG29_AURMS|nr:MULTISPECIES: ion transporter [Aurantimonas]MAP18893.1 ion transporter [Aurantimonas sp.]MCW7542921.1 ion transporter [Aurantimonas litoralis]EAS49396.1 voltage-gated sodium channel [Aurantimonas manganoxydans SI85-9A1]MBC6716844.1 ion transporter [Aurantimonas sp. DM33-3]MCD1643578.1 ion transporter [Aurantimonas coralicida]